MYNAQIDSSYAILSSQMRFTTAITLAPLPTDENEITPRDRRTCAARVDPTSPVTIIPARLLDGLTITRGAPATVNGRSYPTAIVTVQAAGRAPKTLSVVVSTVQARRARPATVILGRDYLDSAGSVRVGRKRVMGRSGGRIHRYQAMAERSG